MQYECELKLGLFHSLNKLFTSTDWAVYLNKAQDTILVSKYSKDNEPGHDYFEASEKVRTELAPLVKNHIVLTGAFSTGGAELHSNAVFADLPSDHLYSLKEHCVVNYSDCNSNAATNTARVLPIRHDEYEMNIKNPFGKPYEELVWRMDYGITGAKKYELIHGEDQSLASYTLRYLKRPLRIDIITGVDCELHISLHEEIVDMAVQFAVMSIPQKNNVEQNTES